MLCTASFIQVDEDLEGPTESILKYLNLSRQGGTNLCQKAEPVQGWFTKHNNSYNY